MQHVLRVQKDYRFMRSRPCAATAVTWTPAFAGVTVVGVARHPNPQRSSSGSPALGPVPRINRPARRAPPNLPAIVILGFIPRIHLATSTGAN